MSTTTKNIIVELNKGEKLNGDNYEIWHYKVQYILEEQEALETLNHMCKNMNKGTLPNIEEIRKLTWTRRKRYL